MPPEDKSRIENLKQSLYSRAAPDVRTKRRLRFSERSTEVKTDWEHPDENEEEPVLNRSYENHSMSFFIKLLIGSAVFCVLAVAIGAYLFLNGANLISANNIDISISGPVSVPGGTPVSLSVTVTNKNSVALRLADLSIQFPAGTTDPADTSKPLDSHQELLGDIPPGGSVTKTVEAVLFGEENLQKQVTATVTYGIKGSSSVFTKEQIYEVLINSSPVILSVSSFNEVTSGSSFDVSVDIKSNSGNILKNVLLKAVYPFGYAFGSASPAPLPDNATWVIGDIPPGGDRKVVIHGVLTGEESDLRAFHFSVGAGREGSPRTIAVSYMDAEQDITIKKPFVSLGISIDGDSSASDYAAQSGRSLQVQIHWVNNLPVTLSNLVIDAHLSGSAYDKNQVSSQGGYFRSSTDDIIWSRQTNSELESAAAGDNGSVSFSITPADVGASGKNIINPEITVSGTVTADRTAESGVSDTAGPTVRNVKIASNVSLSGRIVRTIGPFQNSGPIPPKAEQKTTYTVVWTVDNATSAAGNAVVVATLPPYVTWLGQVNPSSENVTYDQPSGAVTWNIGALNPYTVSTNQRREVDFQVSLLPSVDQVGHTPVLVNQATLSAVDDWTGTTLQSTQGYLTTSFSTDPAYKQGNETVAQ